MAKSSGLMGDREKEIAGRIREVRFYQQLSQPKFARAAGISLDQAASFEYARTPLTVAVAEKISAAFDINLIWLASGAMRMSPSLGSITKMCPEIKGDQLLSLVDLEAIGKQAFDREKYAVFSLAAILDGQAAIPSKEDAALFAGHFRDDLDDYYSAAPQRAKEKLLSLLVRTLAKFSADWELGSRENPGGNRGAPKKRAAGVKSINRKIKAETEMETLLGRVRGLVATKGMKAKLAGALGIPQSRLSEWLGGQHEPSGEITLKLLAWVEEQERRK